MSKLDDLIKELCPNGVEFKNLKDVVKSINIGINPRKFFKLNPIDGDCFYVTVRELNGINGVKEYDKTDKINKDAVKLINSRSNIEIGDILFSNTGTVGKLALVTEKAERWNVNEGIYVIKPILNLLNSKFLYYFLGSKNAITQYSSKFTGSTLKHITQDALLSLDIPVPPLPIQCEIVRILDNFAELTAELTARKKQYEYYRDKLLNSNNDTPIKNFGDISKIVRGASPRPISQFITDDENGMPWIKIGDVKPDDKYVLHTKEKITLDGAKKSRIVKKGDFILSNSMSFGRPYIVNIEGCIHDGWLSISNFEDYFISDYLYYLLNSQNIQKEMRKRASFGGAVTNLNADIVKSLELPIPDKKYQQKIVNILDKFDSYCNDITKGLPAEIEARNKQYEYYRNKLLTFKRLEK